MNRRQILLGIPAVAMMPPLVAALAKPALAEPLEVRKGDRVLGEAEAPITIVEYASLTCPHCASFHTGILPQVKSEWIEKGEAKLVYRHFPLDQLALRAAVAADAMPNQRAFFAYLDILFEKQAEWSRAQDPLAILAQQAQLAGVGRSRFEQAMQDEAAANAIVEKMMEARDELGVESTPTFFINGEKLVGVSDYQVFAEALEEAQSGT